MQKVKEALADLNSVLSLKSDYEQALVQRSKLLLRMGRCHDAELDLLALRKKKPDHKEVSQLSVASQCATETKKVT